MSSSDEDVPPPPARDPLLDDPAFAELVGPPPAPPEEVFAEPVEVPVESLPVAQVIRPKAIPIPPVPAAKIAPHLTMPVPVETEPPKPKWFMACSVIGCLGILVIGAVAALLWIAITILSNLGDKIGETKPTSRAETRTQVPRGPIAISALGGDVEIPLDGRVEAVARGGGGRFLLMKIVRKKEIHVFDANQAQVVFKVPANEAGTLFTASSDKIFVFEPLEKKLYRFDLFSGTPEAEEKVALPRVNALAAGSASGGPLYVLNGAAGGRLRIHQFDTATLKSIREDSFTFPVEPDAPMIARASENGVVLGVSCKDGAAAVWFGGNNPTAKLLVPERGSKPKWAVPSADGQFFYTPRGVFDTGGNPFVGTRDGLYTFPTAHGADWFLSLDEAEEDQVSGTPRQHPAASRNLAQASALDKAFLTGLFPANELKASELTAADRIHYWPGARLAAVIPDTRAEQTAKLQLYKMPAFPVK